jgi:carbon storage regulator
MLILSRRPSEELVIGDDVVVKILGINGQQVRLGITAPKTVRIDRREVRNQIDAAKDPTP